MIDPRDNMSKVMDVIMTSPSIIFTQIRAEAWADHKIFLAGGEGGVGWAINYLGAITSGEHPIAACWKTYI